MDCCLDFFEGLRVGIRLESRVRVRVRVRVGVGVGNGASEVKDLVLIPEICLQVTACEGLEGAEGILELPYIFFCRSSCRLFAKADASHHLLSLYAKLF